MRGSPLFDDALVCEVLSEAARDGTPLKVENRLDVRLDATYYNKSVSGHALSKIKQATNESGGANGPFPRPSVNKKRKAPRVTFFRIELQF